MTNSVLQKGKGPRRERAEGGHDRAVEKLLVGLLAYPQGAKLREFFPDRAAPPAVAVNAVAVLWESGWVTRDTRAVYTLTPEGVRRAREQQEMDADPAARKRILRDRANVTSRVVKTRAFRKKQGGPKHNRADVSVSVPVGALRSQSLFPDIATELDAARRENMAQRRGRPRGGVTKQPGRPVRARAGQPELF